MTRFDIHAPLPERPLLLEASAGTGKTWNIAALALRYLAEGRITIDQLLCITFTGKAAGELRARIFERLQRAERVLEARRAGAEPGEPDSVEVLVASSDLDARLSRVRAALAHFDEAMIGTIHQFCGRALRELGVLGDWDPGETTLATPRTLIDQCATDVYLERYVDEPNPPYEPRRARLMARKACTSVLPPQTASAAQRDYLDAVRERFSRRKRLLGLVTFDDTVTRLRDVLLDPATGGEVGELLRHRYGLVMVDEFQDTDPLQWAIIEAAFVRHGHPTILIGDPKQSIYGFRNADLQSYLEAAAAMETQRLTRNHRTDEPLVRAVEWLFGDVALGDPSITVEPVDCEHREARLAVGNAARLWLRRASEDSLVDDQAVTIANDVAYILQGLLAHADIEGRPVRHDDVAILVRSTQFGKALAERLRGAGIPVAFTGAGNVWHSSAASDWLALLEAMLDTTRAAVMSVALTDLVGAGPAELVDTTKDTGPRVTRWVLELARTFEQSGIASVVAAVTGTPDLHARLASLPDGTRRLSDLMLAAELLADGPDGDLQELIAWLRRQIDSTDDAEDSQSLRLDSDRPSVSIMTLHSAKGLEFPVVLLPEVSKLTYRLREPFQVVSGGERRLYVGQPPRKQDELAQDFIRQQREEELRLFYVGLTRARHLAVAWHVDGRSAAEGALTALLARDRSVTGLKSSYPSCASFRAPGDRVFDGAIDSPTPTPSPPPPPRDIPLRLVAFDRQIDHTWRRTSYSALTAGLHDLATLRLDEPEEIPVVQETPTGSFARPSPMATLPGGARFGTVVHAALEELDWTRADLDVAAAEVTSVLAPRFGFDEEVTTTLADALVAVCTTPLGPLVPGAALRDLPIAQRLPELDFDLPLAQFGRPRLLGALAELMGRHLPPGDPLAGYPAHLLDTPAAEAVLNGFLTGSIDAVLRTPAGGFVVVDYKTNRLPVGPDEELMVGHYRPAAMAQAMIESHYPLQALLYCIALHRFLAWRLPGYEPATHLAGVGYLFVRGMAGPETPTTAGSPCGVFTWYPPAELVLAASELIAGGGGDDQA